MSPISGGQNKGSGSMKYNNFSSILPEVYLGHPNRIDRYTSLNNMVTDAEVGAALDIISEFCTQNSEQNDTPFDISFKDKPTETEISIIKKQLDAWCSLNQFDRRLFKIFRNVLKYGDQVFIRDPETFKLFWVDMIDVIKIIVNESEGKVPEQYIIRNINPNFENLSVNQVTAETLYNSTNIAAGGSVKYSTPTDSHTVSRFSHGLKEIAIEAQHIVHLSLTEGLDTCWPFGTSILENIYKVFKQKELIEDAIIIYRIQRAPERRIFKIDVGDMPSHLAMAFVERIKNEIHQRRIPSASGGGCFAMDTKIPLLDGRKPTLLELSKDFEQGKENWIYSCNPVTGEAVPGKITWAGVTQQSAKVIKVTLDNGESIICTPEHKFPIIGKGKVEAKDIEPLVDSLISFNTRLHSINEEKENNSHNPQYQQVFDHSTKSWKFTHRIVANYFKERSTEQNLVFLQKFENEQKRVIHHKDFNKYNNSPDNLVFMYGADHFMLHSDSSNSFWKNLTPEQKNEIAERRKFTISQWSEEKKNETATKIGNANKNRLNKLKFEEPEKYQTLKNIWLQNIKLESKSPWRNQKLEWSDSLFEIVKNTVLENESNWLDTCILLSQNDEFMKKYVELNQQKSKTISHLQLEVFSSGTLRNLLKTNGFSTWRKFKKSLNQPIRKKTLSLNWDNVLLSEVVKETKNCNGNKKKIIEKLNSNFVFMAHYAKINEHLKSGCRGNVNYFAPTTLLTCIKSNGYKHWTDFKQKLDQYNHKVLSIEWLDEPIEVGTITVDGHEELHNFHTFAIEQGIYTFNSSFVDSSYQTLGVNEDYYFPIGRDGKGSSVETLPGGQNLNDIADLKFFTNKMFRGLRIPSSYLPTTSEDSAAVHSDGKVGTALIQEHRFNQYCKRLQLLVCSSLNTEFKTFLKWRGLNIDSGMFDIKFNEPQNFASYRQSELDSAKIQGFTQLDQFSYLSKQFLLERYLGLTEDEILKNSQLWRNENPKKDEDTYESDTNLRNVGVSAGGIDTDLEGLEPESEEGGMGEEGEMGATPGAEEAAPPPVTAP